MPVPSFINSGFGIDVFPSKINLKSVIVIRKISESNGAACIHLSIDEFKELTSVVFRNKVSLYIANIHYPPSADIASLPWFTIPLCSNANIIIKPKGGESGVDPNSRIEISLTANDPESLGYVNFTEYEWNSLYYLRMDLLRWYPHECSDMEEIQNCTTKGRLKTFKHLTKNVNVSIKSLARSGFIYRGVDDVVQCVYCEGYLSKWKSGDIALFEHYKWYQNCPFIKAVYLNEKTEVEFLKTFKTYL